MERPPDDRMRIVLRPLATPLPLGFYAFGMGMLLTGAVAVGWLPRQSVLVSVILLTFVGPLELLAALSALFARDSVAFTGLALFAASWITTGVTGLVASGGAEDTLALFDFLFAAFVLALAVVAAREKPPLTVVLLVAVPNAVLAGVAELTGQLGYRTYAGGFGIALAILGFVGGTALLLEDLRGRPLSGAARRGSSEAALRRGLPAQVEDVGDEAGVRRQL